MRKIPLFSVLALGLAAGAPAGAKTMTLPASTTTIHERAADWAGAALSGAALRGDTLSLPPGVREGTVTGAPLTVPAFDELVPSWNSVTGAAGSVTVEVRAGLAGGGWTRWYSFGRWSAAEGRTSLNGQMDGAGQVLTDTLRLTRPSAQVQYRVTLRGEGTSLRLLALTTSDRARLAQGAGQASDRRAWGHTVNVPQRSQMIYPGGGEVWCSPTSVSMILANYGVDVPVPQAAGGMHDQAYDGTGNWPFNTAYAGERGMRAFVTRLPSLAAAERFTAAGVPLAVSLGWKKGELPGAAIPSSTGHLMVLVGFDAQGNPVLNDPAAPGNDTVRRPYPRAAFERLWLSHSGGLSYVIAPAGTPLP